MGDTEIGGKAAVCTVLNGAAGTKEGLGANKLDCLGAGIFARLLGFVSELSALPKAGLSVIKSSIVKAEVFLSLAKGTKLTESSIFLPCDKLS